MDFMADVAVEAIQTGLPMHIAHLLRHTLIVHRGGMAVGDSAQLECGPAQL